MTSFELANFQASLGKLESDDLKSLYRKVLGDQDAARGTKIAASIFIKRAVCEMELESRGCVDEVRSCL